MRNLRKFLWMLRSRDARLWALVRRWMWSDKLGVGMQRPLDTPMKARNPRIPLTMRPSVVKPPSLCGCGVLPKV